MHSGGSKALWREAEAQCTFRELHIVPVHIFASAILLLHHDGGILEVIHRYLEPCPTLQ
jgi:hypothetical protein